MCTQQLLKASEVEPEAAKLVVPELEMILRLAAADGQPCQKTAYHQLAVLIAKAK